LDSFVSSKERYLSAYLDAMPGEASIQDLEGNCLYTNVKYHKKESSDGPCHISSSKLIQFPLTNEKGETIAIGSFRPVLKTSISSNDLTRPNEQHDQPQATLDKQVLDSEEEKDSDDEIVVHSPQPGHNYQRLFHKMPMGAALSEIVTDENNLPIDWIFREVNPAFEHFTGLKASEITGRLVTKCMPGIENDPCDWIGHFGHVALSGDTYHFDKRFDETLQRWYGGVAYQPARQDGFFVCLFQDVSDRIQAEEDLRESEERHRNLFESMMQGVVYQDASGNIIAANPSAERILGLTVDQMMGRTSVDPRWKSMKEDGSDFPGDQHPSMVALKTGKPVTGVLMGLFHPATNKHHWIIIDAIPRFRPGESEPFQVHATFTDMTQTKEFERRLLREKDRAEMADRLKSAFLANMSHEIRTPLNGIIGHIDLVLSNDLAQEFQQENRDGLHVARQSGELLIAIIQDILDLSKIEAGQLDIEHNGHFQLRALLDQVASLGETMITQRQKTISFEHSIDEKIQDWVCGDFFRVQQVLNNLVSNSIKFADTGKVALSIIATQDNMLEFTVSDTGKGIPPEHQESVFEPFRQVEFGDTRKHGGTGLGLTISRKLVNLMGGTISLQSSVEKPSGTSFRFTIPYRVHIVSDVDVAAVLPYQSHLNEKIALTDNAKVGGKVLVAEDETVSRRLVHRMLGIAGYDVILAEDGAQAVESFQSHDDIMLILMDVQMPRVDGLTATAMIRELERKTPGKRPVPIIALSAGAMKGDNERGFAAGMTGYLTKPVNFKLLKETLRTHLGC
jgi:signal transduction histidine kinase